MLTAFRSDYMLNGISLVWIQWSSRQLVNDRFPAVQNWENEFADSAKTNWHASLIGCAHYLVGCDFHIALKLAILYFQLLKALIRRWIKQCKHFNYNC